MPGSGSPSAPIATSAPTAGIVHRVGGQRIGVDGLDLGPEPGQSRRHRVDLRFDRHDGGGMDTSEERDRDDGTSRRSRASSSN